MIAKTSKQVVWIVITAGCCACWMANGSLAAAPNPNASAAGQSATARKTIPRPRELGDVMWRRGFEEAAKEAKNSDKPLLVLFQEVPGCDTCVHYGQRVLSHPLLVEAAETLFVPVVVYNNIKGDDERALKSFDEPAWNNPVVRIVTAERTPLASRVAKDYTVAGLASAMTDALQKLKREVPVYLDLLDAEQYALRQGPQRATFAMHCFWEGEAALGTMPGVIATAPGFLDDIEVVEIEFNPAETSFKQLLHSAAKHDCASKVFARTDAQATEAVAMTIADGVKRTDDPIRLDKQPKYYLSNTPLRSVPMTRLQASRVNAAIGPKTEDSATAASAALRSLSPRQIALYRTIQAHPSAPWPNSVHAPDMVAAWRSAQKVAASVRAAD